MSDCLFCKIAAGEIPSKKLYEDDRLLARSDESWLVVDSSGEVYWQWDAPMQTEATSF